MEAADVQEPPRKRRRKAPTSQNSYVFRPLLEDIALAAENHTSKVHITCVELWESNLYIGTSAAEILHYVAIPPDPTDAMVSPSYIFASRLQPNYNQTSAGTAAPGVQQILVLLKVAKACVLCNGTLTFYSLPELSPAFGNIVVLGCSWIGGTNLNGSGPQDEDGETVMICIKSRIRLVRIGDEPRRIRNIEFPGCLAIARRDNFACVADAQGYALLDVDNQQKISLFPVSSLDDNATSGQVEDISTHHETSRPSSGMGDPRGHGRSTSLGTFVSGLGRRSPQSRSQERSGRNTPEPRMRAASPLRPSDRPRSGSVVGDTTVESSVSEKPLPPPPNPMASQQAVLSVPSQMSIKLTPHICSPTPTEFLLTTGTTAEEPGVGIFVNLDGDVVRGTLQFDRYPTSVVVDGNDRTATTPSTGTDKPQEGYVLASTLRKVGKSDRNVVEVRRWDIDDDNNNNAEHLNIPFPFEEQDFGEHDPVTGHAKLRSILSYNSEPFPEVGQRLRLARMRLPSMSENVHTSATDVSEEERNEEERAFGQRLGMQSSRIVLWCGSSIWWLMRNPLVLRLDGAIDAAMEVMIDQSRPETGQTEILRIITSIQEYEANTETDFLSLKYIRQKAGLILFANTLSQDPSSSKVPKSEMRTEDLLIESGLDPRILLSLIPLLAQEIIEGPKGIWVHAGLIWVVEQYAGVFLEMPGNGTIKEPLRYDDLANMVKRYLVAWRQRKGFGSIADEVEVFKSVDAALLLLLLCQDNQHSVGAARPSAVRAELYSLVDSGVDCFERAVVLLERYQRLYVLSRLYQNRKMASKVLETWRRIIEGEKDAGNELRDGENEVRKYLAKIRDTALFYEYGTWLARRNADLGVQVFTDESSRVKVTPEKVVQLFQEQAPDAVKVYLEHLVFGKKKVHYANRLIAYCLDSVLDILGSSEEARLILAESYESYRALKPPKPTYRQFIIDNAVPVPWWKDRLRLLELLGGTHGADFSYDLDEILNRIEPFEQDLVPESIILDGRQGRHKQALRLLTHGLGDYHTSINYCLMGGASIFHPVSGSLTPNEASKKEDQATLFGYLLTEFLQIEDASDRLERTSELLERFGSWYDVKQVLSMIPESWSVELVSGFLVGAFRRLVHDKHEAMVVKALSGAENLQVTSIKVAMQHSTSGFVGSIKPTIQRSDWTAIRGTSKQEQENTCRQGDAARQAIIVIGHIRQSVADLMDRPKQTRPTHGTEYGVCFQGWADVLSCSKDTAAGMFCYGFDDEESYNRGARQNVFRLPYGNFSDQRGTTKFESQSNFSISQPNFHSNPLPRGEHNSAANGRSSEAMLFACSSVSEHRRWGGTADGALGLTLNDDGRIIGAWTDLMANNQINYYTSGGDEVGKEILLITAYDVLHQAWRPLMWAPAETLVWAPGFVPEQQLEVYDNNQYGISPPTTPGLIAAEEAFTRNTEVVSYSEVIPYFASRGLRGGEAPAKTHQYNRVKQNCNSLITINNRNKWTYNTHRTYRLLANPQTFANSKHFFSNLLSLQPAFGSASHAMANAPKAELYQQHEEGGSSQNTGTYPEPELPVTPKRKTLRGPGPPTVLSPPVYSSSQVFAPSPLYHAHPALSAFNDAFSQNAQEAHGVAWTEQVIASPNNSAATFHPLATSATQSLPPINQYLAHGSPTGRSSQAAAISHPRRLNVHDYLSSPTSPPPPKSLGNAEITGSPNSSIAGLQPLNDRLIDVPSHRAPSSTSSGSNDKLKGTTESNKSTHASPLLREVPALVRGATAPDSKKSHVDPPQNFFEEAVLRLINAATLPTTAATPPTPPRPTAFSPISQGLASPRPAKRAKRGETAVDEDPFEDFDSGSEVDDEEDADFGAGAGAASPSLSVEEISSRSPTPTDDEDGVVTSEKKSRTKSGPRKPSAAHSSRTDARAEKAGAMTVSGHKVKARRNNGMGDWPTATEAVQTTADHAQAVTKVEDMNETGVMVVRGQHVDAAAAAVTEQQPIDKTERDGAGWVLVAEMVAGERKVSWKWN
ncbi:MAG: hypothetical protein Q9184_005598 [Pyrenodesmia sp. 2 TL-2023]